MGKIKMLSLKKFKTNFSSIFLFYFIEIHSNCADIISKNSRRVLALLICVQLKKIRPMKALTWESMLHMAKINIFCNFYFCIRFQKVTGPLRFEC